MSRDRYGREVASDQFGPLNLALEISNPQVPWGGLVRGSVSVHTPTRCEQIVYLEASLRVRKADPKGKPFSQMQQLSSGETAQTLSRCSWKDVQVSRDEPLRLAFAVEMPYGAPIDEDVEITAGMVRPDGDIGRIGIPVEVQPPAEFREIAEALAKAASGALRPWRSRGDWVEVHVESLRGASSRVRRLELQLKRSERMIHGCLTIERGIIAELFGHQSRRCTFSVPVERASRMSDYFRRVLQSARSGDLPLPSDPAALDPSQRPVPSSRDPEP